MRAMPLVYAITGASRGIGQACAVKLAKPGVTLALMARSEESLLATRRLCESQGARVECFGFDMAKTEGIEAEVKRITTTCGPVCVLINNAGLWIEKNFMTGDMAAWEEALDVNLKSVMRLTRHILESMPDEGAVISIASTASRKVYAGGTNYCAAKFGLLGFAGALFEDIRNRGIKVCSILPGVVNTDMHAQDQSFEPDQMIQPSDIADAVAYVLSCPPHVCPTEITLSPQKYPKRKV